VPEDLLLDELLVTLAFDELLVERLLIALEPELDLPVLIELDPLLLLVVPLYTEEDDKLCIALFRKEPKPEDLDDRSALL
jgi:hypothetical protein